MVEQPDAMNVDLSNYAALKALTQTTRCGNFVVSYNPNDTSFISIYHNEAEERERENPKTGWKIHISIDKDNIDKGWEIFAKLAIAYNLMDFKVYRTPENNAKEITVYCGCYQNPVGVIHLRSFLKALNEEFKKAGIKPVDSKVLEDSLIVSDFISARNDYVHDLPGPSSLGAPQGYVAGIHILFLKQMHHNYQISSGALNFKELFELAEKTYKNNPMCAQILKRNRDAFKREIESLFNKIKNKRNPEWYNVANERDFLNLFNIQQALIGEIKEDEQLAIIREKSESLHFPSRETEELLLSKEYQNRYKAKLQQDIKLLKEKISQTEKDKKETIRDLKAQYKKASSEDLAKDLAQRLQDAQMSSMQVMTPQALEDAMTLAELKKEFKEYKMLSSQDQAAFLMHKDPAFKTSIKLHTMVVDAVVEAIRNEPQFKRVTIDPKLLNSAIVYSIAKLEGAPNKEAAKKLVNWTTGKDGIPKPKEKNAPLTMSMIHDMTYTAYLEAADKEIEKMKLNMLSEEKVKMDAPRPLPSTPARRG